MEELKQLMREGFAELGRRIGKVEQRMDGMAQALAQADGRLTNLEAATAAVQDSQMRMEQEMQRNFGALYDAWERQIDVNEKVVCALARIESKLERADLRALYSANKLIRQGWGGNGLFRKITAIALMVIFCCSTVLAASPGGDPTLLEKLTAVENALYGDVRTGALLERVVKLETDFYGAPADKSLLDRVDFLYDGMFTNLGDQPSTLLKLNAVEWSIARAVTSGPVKRRVEELETMIEGSPKSGPFQDRILALSNLAFSGGAAALQRQVVPADTLIKIAITSPLDSKTAAVGDRVTYRVEEDVIVDGTLFFAKGAEGSGVVTKASRSQNFGRDAKLEVSFDRVTAIDGAAVDTFLGEKAKQEMEQMALAAGASIAGMVLLGPVGIVTGAFVKGKEIEIPEGAEMYIQTKLETEICGVQTGAAGA